MGGPSIPALNQLKCARAINSSPQSTEMCAVAEVPRLMAPMLAGIRVDGTALGVARRVYENDETLDENIC